MAARGVPLLHHQPHRVGKAVARRHRVGERQRESIRVVRGIGCGRRGSPRIRHGRRSPQFRRHRRPPERATHQVEPARLPARTAERSRDLERVRRQPGRQRTIGDQALDRVDQRLRSRLDQQAVVAVEHQVRQSADMGGHDGVVGRHALDAGERRSFAVLGRDQHDVARGVRRRHLVHRQVGPARTVAVAGDELARQDLFALGATAAEVELEVGVPREQVVEGLEHAGKAALGAEPARKEHAQRSVERLGLRRKAIERHAVGQVLQLGLRRIALGADPVDEIGVDADAGRDARQRLPQPRPLAVGIRQLAGRVVPPDAVADADHRRAARQRARELQRRGDHQRGAFDLRRESRGQGVEVDLRCRQGRRPPRSRRRWWRTAAGRSAGCVEPGRCCAPARPGPARSARHRRDRGARRPSRRN